MTKPLFTLLSAFLLAIPGYAQESIGDEGQEIQVDTLSTDNAFRSRRFITMTVGIEHDEKLPPLPENVEFIGDFRKLVTAEYSRDINTVRFNPKKEGYGTFVIRDKKTRRIVGDYQIDVKRNKLDKVVREIRALLGDIEGINIKIVNNKVVVDGQILLPKDLARIYNVIQQFGTQASSLVTLSPLAQKKIAEFISRDINNPEIEVRAVNEKIILQGWASSDEEKVRAEIIAKTYMPDMVIDSSEGTVIRKRKPVNDGVINLLQVKAGAPAPPKKMIQLVVHYVELNKDYSKAFKFQFTPELSDNSQLTFQTGGSEAGGVISSLTGVVSNLLPKLNWAKEHGHARILESTSLIVEDGKKGEIKQVTNQPYSVIGKEGQTGTAFAEIGIRSAITPTITGEQSGSVGLDMEFSLSNLIGAASGGAPITSANTINSAVTIRDRQSAAIGGLIRNSSFTNYNRLPSSVKNPIISLYASKDFQRKQSQFVVFVTPIIKTSASAGAEQIKKKFRLRD